ncbi:translocation/assembly module TamB domain-containing protein [Holophaga foetida]|uniref:translocation/assembly module TamB domain-containing protein n=1 Tax=Holophaga foetida TaxID=35839 RepID=UPI001FCAAF9E|nr:translocation/assembly module TamB domain-containing protein [Holophaga foetida]
MAAVRKIWGRRGFRRMVYVLAAGAVVLEGASWTLQRPFFSHWVSARVGRLLQEETGLSFQAEDLEFHLLESRLIINNFSIGGRLLQARRLDVQVHLLTLLSRWPRIRYVHLEGPRIELDRETLGQIRLKPRPKSATTPQVYLGEFRIEDARLTVREPSWGVPRVEAFFRASGYGQGANRVETRFQASRLEVGAGAIAQQGSLGLQANLSEQAVEIRKGGLQLGQSRLQLEGRYEIKPQRLLASLDGHLDLGQAAALAPKGEWSRIEGGADLKARFAGTRERPTWTLALSGKDLSLPVTGLGPSTLRLEAQGTASQAKLERLEVEAPEGKAEAEGEWRRESGTDLRVKAEGVGLAPLVPLTRFESLRQAQASLQGELHLPGSPWSLPRLDQVRATFQGSVTRQGRPVGKVDLALDQGNLRLDDLALDLEDIRLAGSATARLGPKGLMGLSAAGEVQTDAAQVARNLSAWKLVDLDMAGAVKARAEVSWSPGTGLDLAGHVDVESPRWHGARVDRLSTEVSIRGSELRLDGISLAKGEGRGGGELWLTWADLPEGSSQIDMCYWADRLPVREGLLAGDVDSVRVDGTGSGWARLHGPFRSILMEGQAQAVKAEVYGLSIPAVSAQFRMDIASGRFEIRDLRVAEGLDALGQDEAPPRGLLALQGWLDMDLERLRWHGALKGPVDSKVLGLSGARFLGQMDAKLEGPMVSPMGPVAVPSLTVSLTRGRAFLGTQSLEGLEGGVELAEGALLGWFGMEGKAGPFARVHAFGSGENLIGAVDLQVNAETADTPHLAARLTRDALKDARVDLKAEGAWDRDGLHWKGRLDRFEGHFEGLDLVQTQPSRLAGDGEGLGLDLALKGFPVDPQGRPLATGGAEVQLSGWAPFLKENPLKLSLGGSADLTDLKVLLDRIFQPSPYSLLADLKPSGNAQFALTLNGTYTDPMLDGHLGLKGGRLHVRTYPQSIENVDFTVRFKGREIWMSAEEPLRGTLAQGDLKAWGKATWQMGGLSDYALDARLEGFQFRDIPEGFELQGSLEAALKGNDREGGRLKGRLWAKHMLYRADLDLTDLILSGALGSTSTGLGLDPDDPLARIDLDLDLILEEPWQFETNLLKLQGRPVGSFKVLGTAARPGLRGKMDFLPGGRLTNLLPAGDIVLERGSIDFTDPRVFNPVLNLQGRVDVSPYVVNLSINGSLNQLSMNPTSTPSLRQDEIVAILIDPSTASTIGTATGPSSQSVMSYGLASTTSGLLSSLTIASFQERVRKIFSLDRVNVSLRPSSTGTAETSVTLGKSLEALGGAPILLNYRKSGNDVTTSGQMEWRLGNLVLQLGASSSSTNGLSPSGEIRHTWSPR